MTPATNPDRPARSDASWRRTGQQIGSELGQIDRQAGTRRRPDQISLPPEVPETYVLALREAYQAAVTGTPLVMGDI